MLYHAHTFTAKGHRQMLENKWQGLNRTRLKELLTFDSVTVLFVLAETNIVTKEQLISADPW